MGIAEIGGAKIAFVVSDYVGDRYGCTKSGANPSTGGFWANG